MLFLLHFTGSLDENRRFLESAYFACKQPQYLHILRYKYGFLYAVFKVF